jgi:putative Holliday junction resolvase
MGPGTRDAFRGVHPAVTSRAPERTVLAFDYGTRRIGIAVGNTVLRSARALETIDDERNEVRFVRIGALIDEWQPGLLVVGIPVHADGTEHAMTQRARRFARQLAGRFGVPVAHADERHTTAEAAATLGERRAGRGGRGERDALAAQLILQGWFDEHA